MRGIEHTEGYWFPWAVGGSQFEQAELWDEETYYVSGSGWTPSNLSTSATPVVGPRTAWWLGLTAQEMAFAWWRIDRWRQKFIDDISMATSQASISADFSPTDQLTFSRLTATTTLPFFRSDRRALIRSPRNFPEGETPGRLMSVHSTTLQTFPAGATAPGFSTSVGPSTLFRDWDEVDTAMYSSNAGLQSDTLTLDGAFRRAQRGIRYCPADGKYYVCMPTLSMRLRANSYGYPETRTVAVKIPVYEPIDTPGIYQVARFTGPGRKWAVGPLDYKVIKSDSIIGKQLLYYQTPATAYGSVSDASGSPTEAPSFLPGSSYFLPSQVTGEDALTYTFAKGTEFEKVFAVPLFKRLITPNMPRTWATTSLISIPNIADAGVQDTILINGSVTGEDVPDDTPFGIYNVGGSLFDWSQLELPGANLAGNYQEVPNWIESMGSRTVSIELSPHTYYGYGGVYNTTTGAYVAPTP